MFRGDGDFELIGNCDFIYLEKEVGVWWLVDYMGKWFIMMGMNYVGEGGVFFNEVNEGWMIGEFGLDIWGVWGGLNFCVENIGDYVDMVVKDFKDYGFNIIFFYVYVMLL